MYHEGVVPFEVAGTGKFTTWYCSYGQIDSARPCLIVLHGGPGACHEYMLPLADLHERYNIPVVFYDQIGNGSSTHLPEKNGDKSFWTVSLFIAELDNLIDHLGVRTGFHILGHSWGAMLGSEYAALKPKGLRKLILASGPASIELWIKGVNELCAQLPEEVQKVLKHGDETGDFTSPDYEAATEVFYKKHLCRVEPWPAKEVEVALNHMSKDPTVYGTMWGFSELAITGLLKEWSVIPKLDQIEAPTLVLNGRYDEAQDVSVKPFFEKIKQVRWLTLNESSHMAHVEERQRYVDICAQFLEA